MLPSPITTGLDLGLASESHHPNPLNQSAHAIAREIDTESWYKVCHTNLINDDIGCGQYRGEKENAQGLGEADLAVLLSSGLVLITTPQTKSLQLHWGGSQLLYGIWLVKAPWGHS